MIYGCKIRFRIDILLRMVATHVILFHIFLTLYLNPMKTQQFYICSSVHRNSRLNKSNRMQQYADIYLLLNYSTCFGRPSLPSSRVHKTVVAASGTDHTIWWASFFKRDQIRSDLVTFVGACSSDSMIYTRGCYYSFIHTWWWQGWTPETCTLI